MGGCARGVGGSLLRDGGGQIECLSFNPLRRFGQDRRKVIDGMTSLWLSHGKRGC